MREPIRDGNRMRIWPSPRFMRGCLWLRSSDFGILGIRLGAHPSLPFRRVSFFCNNKGDKSHPAPTTALLNSSSTSSFNLLNFHLFTSIRHFCSLYTLISQVTSISIASHPGLL